jgi:hypothetical protein
VVPGGVQGYDRYAYANNSPLVFSDPTGHISCYGGRYDDGLHCAKKEDSQPPVSTTLQPGQIITRYGSNTGQYASPIGTSVAARALPPDVDTTIISGFEVAKPIENVLTGTAKAWFGQPGGGVQYFFGTGRTLQSLVAGGYLTDLP